MGPAPLRPRLLFVGSHRADAGAYPSVGQQLAARWTAGGGEALLATSETGAARKLWAILRAVRGRRHDYDVCVIEVYSTRAFRYADLASRAARRLGKPVVLWLHGGGLPDLARAHPRRVRQLLTRADAIVAPSPYLAREVAGCLGFVATVIPNPFDFAAFPFRRRENAMPRLLWVRAFERLYRPEVAVDVLARVRAAHPEATLVMIGPDKDGSLEAARARATALGVSDAVSFPGMVSRDEVVRLGQGADVFLNTTTIDNAPRSVVEAQAMGLCVVSTSVGGLPDLLVDGEDALLVPANDPEAMAKAVARILDDAALACRLSENARRAAERAEAGAVLAQWSALLAKGA